MRNQAFSVFRNYSGLVGLLLCLGCNRSHHNDAQQEDQASPQGPTPAPQQVEAHEKDGPTSQPQPLTASQQADLPVAVQPTATADENKNALDAQDDRPRVYAKSRFVWIRGAPTSETQWIGYLWTGGSVPIRAEETPVPGGGCSERWHPVEPHGWVCVDGKRATLDPQDPVVQAVAPYRARIDTPWPHRYAAVNQGLRRHSLLPGPGDQPLPDLPGGLQEGRTRMRDRSTLAYVDEVKRGDDTFLLAADLSWVAKADVEPYEQVNFAGLRLEGDVQLPLAFFRGEDRPGYRRTDAGEFEPTDTKFSRLSWVKLTGKSEKAGRETYFETVQPGIWVRRGGAVVPTPREQTPWGATVGEADTTGHTPPGRATWMEVSILQGWLVAFEGTRPVYATMISAGRGGTPQGDRDPLDTASTPTGAFSITGKFATATMESSVGIVHADVPWTQNFSGPHALHGAYWHDNWGSLMSAGCINVSPRDGRWLYEFTDPPVPEGWHGVRHVPRYGPATRLLVHE